MEAMQQGASPTSFVSFADAFRAARTQDLSAQLDGEAGTALLFAEICAKRAQMADDPLASDIVNAMDDRDAEAWSMEAHTWKLMHVLLAYVRASHCSERLLDPRNGAVPPAQHVYETPLATVQQVLDASPELTELKVRYFAYPDFARVATRSAACAPCCGSAQGIHAVYQERVAGRQAHADRQRHTAACGPRETRPAA